MQGLLKEFPYIFYYPAFPNVNTLHTHGTIINTKKLTLLLYSQLSYRPYSQFVNYPLFSYPESNLGHTLHLFIPSPSLLQQFLILSLSLMSSALSKSIGQLLVWGLS